MRVYAMDHRSRPSSVGHASDTFLFISLLLPAMTSLALAGGLLGALLTGGSLSGGPVGALLAVVVPVVLTERLRQNKLRPLSEAVAAIVDKPVRDLAQALDGAGRFSIEWNPRNVAVNAQVFGLLRPKIGISAGAVALLGLKPRLGKALLAHELGHVKAHDHLISTFWPYLWANLVLTVLVGVASLLSGHPPFAAGGALFLYWSMNLLRSRQEMWADAVAVNALEDKEMMCELLDEHGSLGDNAHSSGTRSATTRTNSIMEDCGVLRMDGRLVLFGAALTLYVIATSSIRELADSPMHGFAGRIDKTSMDLVLCETWSWLLLGPGIVLAELGKGRTRRVPTAAGPSRVSTDATGGL